MDFLDPPSYQLHDVYRSLNVLGKECDLIQSKTYKNGHLVGKCNDKLLFMIVLTIILRLRMKMALRDMAKARNTDKTL